VAETLDDQLTKYLTDAHAIEEQALAQLRSAPDVAADPELAGLYREHLRETEGHEQRVRELLEQRGEKPSLAKDTVMKLGGKGFLLFAKLQPDSPGKLHAHSLSYEALELSSYELLRGTADRAGEEDVAQAAAEIARDEAAMMERLEGTFEEAVEASLSEVGRDNLPEQLRKYLADAHAIEKQAEALLERGPRSSRAARRSRRSTRSTWTRHATTRRPWRRAWTRSAAISRASRTRRFDSARSTGAPSSRRTRTRRESSLLSRAHSSSSRSAATSSSRAWRSARATRRP
jgi:ferritin-like metal-binding protein YciE